MAAAAPARVLRLVTYNVDGLSEAGLVPRAEAVCKLLLALQPPPDVVLLQEVVAENRAVFQRTLRSTYSYHDGGMSDRFTYHCATLLRKSTATLIAADAREFAQSGMGRHLLAVIADVHGTPCTLLNSHLESTSEGGAPALRKRQLRDVLGALADGATLVSVFGGDTNLRDAEAREVLAEECGRRARDAWEALGRPAACKATWDMEANKNLGIAAPIKCRFDRVYFAVPAGGGGGGAGGGGAGAGGAPAAPRPTAMALLGTAKVPGLALHPSDHWGVVVDFALPPGPG